MPKREAVPNEQLVKPENNFPAKPNWVSPDAFCQALLRSLLAYYSLIHDSLERGISRLGLIDFLSSSLSPAAKWRIMMEQFGRTHAR